MQFSSCQQLLMRPQLLGTPEHHTVHGSVSGRLCAQQPVSMPRATSSSRKSSTLMTHMGNSREWIDRQALAPLMASTPCVKKTTPSLLCESRWTDVTPSVAGVLEKACVDLKLLIGSATFCWLCLSQDEMIGLCTWELTQSHARKSPSLRWYSVSAQLHSQSSYSHPPLRDDAATPPPQKG